MLKIAHIRDSAEQEKPVKKKEGNPFRNPVFMANLRRKIITEHNEKIRKQKQLNQK